MVAELKEDNTVSGPPSFPVGTVITTFLLLGFFAGLVWFVYTWSAGLNKAPDNTGVSKLNELKAAQQSIIRSDESDKSGNFSRIPLERALKVVAEKQGKDLPFGKATTVAPPIAPKVEEPKKDAAPAKAEAPKTEEPAKDAVPKAEPAKK